MKVLLTYARLYLECVERTLAGLKRNTWTLLLPVPLILTYGFLGTRLAPLGLVGGLLAALAFDALASCYLYFTGEIVSHSRVTLSELPKSISAYFWSILNVTFFLWVAQWALGIALHGNPRASYIFGGIELAALVMLNALPEVIYVRNTFGGLATLQKTISFMQQNWIEWLVPNALLIAIFFVAQSEILAPNAISLVLGSIVLGALVHASMVFRGHLFTVLDGSTHRQRMFRYRWQ